MKKLKVAVLLGGISAERKISLNSGKKVVKALKKSGKYEVLTYDPKNDLGKLIRDKDKIDVALPILHGPYGEDGTIQGFLELLKIPYAFSGVLASSLANNKMLSRRIFESAGLPVPKYQVVTPSLHHFITSSLRYPLVVKPNTQGSSIGVSICRNEKELKKGLKEAFKYDDEVLIEEYIEGLEITGGVLGDSQNPTALPIVEIVPKSQFFDLKSKYDGSTSEIVPARISKEATCLAQNYAKKAHQALGCSGVTRTDMIIRENSRGKFEDIRILEINTIPGFTEESLLPKAAKAAGISFEELLDKLIDLALKERRVSKKP